MDLECFSCFINSLLSALWLVDDSAAVSLRYVLTRDRMTIFCVFQFVPSVVLPAVFLVISWLIHVHSWTSAHLKPWTAQDVITPCNSHTCFTDPNLLHCGKPSELVPSFPKIPSNVEEIRSGGHCPTTKAGDKGREGSAMFTLETIATRCTASLRTSDNHFGLRGVIPLSPSRTLTALSRVSSHTWSSRDSCVGGALPYLRAAPNCCSALTTGSRTTVDRKSDASLLGLVRPIEPAEPRMVALRVHAHTVELFPVYRCVCSLMLFTTSRSVARIIVSKMAPHSDLVSCSVLQHCLMMIPTSCVVLLQKAAGFFFEPARATVPPRAPDSVSLHGVAEPRPPPPDLRRVSLRFFASSTIRASTRAAVVPSSTAGIHRQQSANSQEMAGANGLQQNDHIVHRWMCETFHHRTDCTGET